MKLSTFAASAPCGPKSHRGDSHVVLVLNALQRAKRIALAGPTRGKFGAADQVIDRGEHLIETRINVIDIHADRDAVVPRNAGGARHCGGVVPIDMQHARAGDLFRGDVGGVEAQTFGAVPEDGALAGGLVDDDVGALIGAAWADLDVVYINPGFV